MDKQAVIRRVRITVSVFFGVLTLSLCVLWVRSYWKVEGIHRAIAPNSMKGVRVNPGTIRFFSYHFPPNMPIPRQITGWVVTSESVEPNTTYGPQLEFASGRIGWGFSLPHWLVALVTSVTATAAWPKWSYKFSLRTMLIATTLVAVVLGLTIWAVR